MCGGGSVSYSPPKPVPPSWDKFWDELKLPSEDTGIFIEVTRGCDSVSCKLQCQARGIPKTVMPFEELSAILKFLKGHEHPEIMLYGVGDVSNYPWAEFLKGLGRPFAGILSGARINISPTANDEDIITLAHYGASIHFNVNSIEDAILANLKFKNLGCRMGGIIVPVATGVDWLEIMKTSTINIEFNSFTPSWSKRYISSQKFKDSMMSLGIATSPVSYELKSGFKILIEKCVINEKKDTMSLTMRRCFQPDSHKTVFNFLGMEQKENRNCEKIYENLKALAKINPDCAKCSKTVWYYNFRR